MKRLPTIFAALLGLLFSTRSRTARAEEPQAEGVGPEAPVQSPTRLQASKEDEGPTMDRVREQQRFLSSLWIFASLNYLYCDVIGLMDSNMLRQYLKGEVNDFTINDNFLLAATALMEVPMSMIVLSTALNPKASRIANVAAGALMTVVQAGTLFTGKPTSYYAFSSGVEIATTSFIAVYSLFFMKPPKVTPILEVKHDGLAVKAGFAF